MNKRMMTSNNVSITDLQKSTTFVRNQYWLKAIVSFFVVLFTMPLGHAMMMLMERYIAYEWLHTTSFIMGLLGLLCVIIGALLKGDTKQTLWGLIGGLLFWTGWVEFLFQYYAVRWGTQPEIMAGKVVTNPEYLILPATFGLWMMVVVFYVFSTRTSCPFISWFQCNLLPQSVRNLLLTITHKRNSSIVTFMELNMILWTSYLLLMFCYDTQFLGDHHPVTAIVAVACFISSLFIFKKQLRLRTWGANLRMAIATVIVFWVPVEVVMRLDLLHEIWLEPWAYKPQMTAILLAFLFLLVYILLKGRSNESRR